MTYPYFLILFYCGHETNEFHIWKMNQANQVPSATTSEVPIPKQGLNKGSLETICSAPLQFQGHSILQPGRLGRSWKLQKNTNLADSVETDASSKPPAIWIILCRLQLNLNACPNSPNTQTMQLKRKDHNCHGDYANSSSLISLYCFWPFRALHVSLPCSGQSSPCLLAQHLASPRLSLWLQIAAVGDCDSPAKTETS